MRILIIDSDREWTGRLQRFLEDQGFAVDSAHEPKRAPVDRTSVYDVIAIGGSWNGLAASDLCKRFRAEGISAPVIGMCDGYDVADRLQFFASGADDCLGRPFSFFEMLARIRALSRRQPTLLPDIIQCGPIMMDTAKHAVKCGRKAISLSMKEFCLLEMLMRRSGRVVSKSDLFEHLWGIDADPCSHRIESHMHNLRRKLGKISARLISNVPGFGYIIEDK